MMYRMVKEKEKSHLIHDGIILKGLQHTREATQLKFRP